MAWWKYNKPGLNFLYSEDSGSTFAPPRLDASIITDGVFDPARIPAVAGSNNFPIGLTTGPVPATTNNRSDIRLSNADAIWTRNAENTADIHLLTGYNDNKVYVG